MKSKSQHSRTGTILVFLLLLSGLLGCSLPGSGAQKAPPLDADTLEQLYIGGPEQLEPGQSGAFKLYSFEYLPVEVAIDAQVAWSIEPESGARMDPGTGVLTVDASTPHGSSFTVIANVEDGKRTLSTTVLVYTLAENSLVGVWVEQAQLSCDEYASLPSKTTSGMSVGELVFDADQSFSVTWRPFELYHDYWGTYTYEQKGGSLSLSVTGGNYEPPDLDGEGSFSLDQDGDLVLVDIWLGSPQGKDVPLRCGYVFTRR